jgi:uncharacterized protein with von Willebrand factor type A (vWA) domain
MQLGDARSGKWPENIMGFARALRRSGVPVDSSRIALSIAGLQCVGLGNKEDVSFALESILVSREQDLEVFRELFELYFKDPQVANKLLAQMLHTAQGQDESKPKKARVSEALRPKDPVYPRDRPERSEELELDAAMTASALVRLRQADFNQLGASEFTLVQRLAREIALPIPQVATRRKISHPRGMQLHWSKTLKSAAQLGGEFLELPKLGPQMQALPILILVDISGSMERYARLLLAFLHKATEHVKTRDVMAFGTGLSDLTPAFKNKDPDLMLQACNEAIQDFAGGTKLGDSLDQLKARFSHRLRAKRTLVLLVSDGLDTGDNAQLEAALTWLKAKTGKICWLNPLLRFDGYQPLAKGASVLDRYCDAKLAIHNLEHLEDLAKAIKSLVQS